MNDIKLVTANFAPALSLSSISPNSGILVGGNTITLTGVNFVQGMTLSINGKVCTDMSVTNSTTAICTVPEGDSLGAKDLVLSNGIENYNLTDGYTYVPPSLNSSSIQSLSCASPKQPNSTTHCTLTPNSGLDFSNFEATTLYFRLSNGDIISQAIPASGTTMTINNVETGNTAGTYPVEYSVDNSNFSNGNNVIILSDNVLTGRLYLYYDAKYENSYSGTGQIINDLSGNNNNGILGSNTDLESSDPLFNSENVKSLIFNG